MIVIYAGWDAVDAASYHTDLIELFRHFGLYPGYSS
jgi:hypothetical protein